MSMSTLIIILILSSTVLILLFFILKSILSPKKISGVEKNIASGKYSAAIKLAKKLLTKDERNTEIRYLLGKAYLSDGKPDLALIEFKKLSKNGLFSSKAKEAEFRSQLAELYTRFNKTEEALQEYVLLIKLDDKNPKYYFEAGKILEDRNKTDHAIAYYEKAVSLDSKYVAAYARLGFLFYRSNHFAEAEKAISTALKLDPSNNETMYYHGRILRAKKDYAPALAAFEKAARDKNFRAKCFLERGITYAETNNIDKAVFEFTRAVNSAKNPNSNDALNARYLLASCYEKKRDLDKAIAEWEQINKINSKFKDVKSKLAEYQDLRSNDRMKEYLTLNKEDFVKFCMAITDQAFNSSVQNARENKNACTIIAKEKGSEKWRNTRTRSLLLIFFREGENISEEYLRSVHEEMKKQNIAGAYIITSSGFSSEAVSFAANRPLELIDRRKLERMLEKVNFNL